MNFLSNNKVTRIAGTTAAATGAVSNLATIDRAGYDTVTFLVSLGAGGAANGIKVQTGASTTSTTVDLAGSACYASTAGKTAAIEIHKPLKRYLRPVILRGASSNYGDVWCILSNPSKVPVTNTVSGALTAETQVSPTTGTA